MFTFEAVEIKKGNIANIICSKIVFDVFECKIVRVWNT